MTSKKVPAQYRLCINYFVYNVSLHIKTFINDRNRQVNSIPRGWFFYFRKKVFIDDINDITHSTGYIAIKTIFINIYKFILSHPKLKFKKAFCTSRACTFQWYWPNQKKTFRYRNNLVKYEGTNYKFDMKYVEIAYFDMLFNMSFYVDMHYKQVRIWISVSRSMYSGAQRHLRPSRGASGGPPLCGSTRARTPARTCMHDLDKRRNLTWFAWNIIRLLCNHHMVHITEDQGCNRTRGVSQ